MTTTKSIEGLMELVYDKAAQEIYAEDLLTETVAPLNARIAELVECLAQSLITADEIARKAMGEIHELNARLAQVEKYGVEWQEKALKAEAALAAQGAEPVPAWQRDAALGLLREIRFHKHRHDLHREWLTKADEVLGTFKSATPPAAEQAEALKDAAGLSLEQEPKYTVNGSSIVNRSSGEAIPEDEPVFVFRARDVHAMYALRDYLGRLPFGAHREAVSRRVMDFFDFKATHPGRMKEPDTAAIASAEGGV